MQLHITRLHPHVRLQIAWRVQTTPISPSPLEDCTPDGTMRISKLEIKNFRSIRSLRLDCAPLVSLLGPNNHGKSNVLMALDFALSTSSKPTPDDFFAHRETGDDELWVDLLFTDLTEQERNTFKRYLLSDGNVRIRKTARLVSGTVELSYNGWIDQPSDDWLRAENAANYTSRESINSTPLKDLVPQGGRLSKAQVEEAQQQYVASHKGELSIAREIESGPLFGQKNVAGGILPEFYLIPAVRDLTEEIKFKSTTTFGRLMTRAVREMAERDPRFTEARRHLQAVMDSLNSRTSSDSLNELAALERNIEAELKAWGVKVNIEVTPPGLETLFELGTDIHVDDGVRTTADRKGHGLQRAVMFALLRSWAAALRRARSTASAQDLSPRRQSDTVIFAMEEPELFLHPHAQRRLSDSLREISTAPEHQVFLCTHSTHFVDLSHYKEVAIITKDNPATGSSTRQCCKELFAGEDLDDRKRRFHMAEWINPDRAEMFFARRVIFVEGETERVLLPFAAEKLGIFDSEVSIIDCGSKHNLPLYIMIAEAFRIPYLVIHDRDPLPDPIPADWSETKTREKRRTFELNAQIAQLVSASLGSIKIFEPNFEGATGVSKNQSEKKGKALAALEHFSNHEGDDLPAALTAIVSAAYSKDSSPPSTAAG